VLENLPDVLEHILWCILFGIMFFVWAGSMLLKGDEGAAPRETSGGLPLLSSMVVLSCVAALVFAFLCVHLRTLLMDHSLLMEYIHMNYSAYIRRGFAELLAAEIIIGFVLLYVLHTAAWVQASEFKHRMVAWLLLLLTLLLSVSCGIRLYYYVLDAGLTLVRTLNSVGIGLSLVCIVYFSIRVVSPVHSSVAAGHIAKMFIVAYVVWACCLPVRSICMFNTWWFQNNPQSIDLTYMRYLGPYTYPYIIEVITKPGFEDEGMDWWLWARNEEFRFEKLSWTEWSPTSDAAHDALKYYTGRK